MRISHDKLMPITCFLEGKQHLAVSLEQHGFKLRF